MRGIGIGIIGGGYMGYAYEIHVSKGSIRFDQEGQLKVSTVFGTGHQAIKKRHVGAFLLLK